MSYLDAFLLCVIIGTIFFSAGFSAGKYIGRADELWLWLRWCSKHERRPPTRGELEERE